MSVRTTAALSLVLLLTAGPAGATDDSDTTPIGTQFRVSGTGAVLDEFAPQVAWNATANEYLVVWSDSRKEGTRGYEIYGRRVGADGALIGTDVRISSSASNEYRPAIVWNQTANQYLVVWEDYRSNATRGTEIYGRRIGANGVPVGSDFRISTSSSYEYDPAVVWNSTTNQYLVVWQDYRKNATRGTEIYGRRIGADGVPADPDFQVSNSTFGESKPAVAWNATANQYLIVWMDSRSTATRGSEIYGRRVDAAGGMVGVNFRVSDSTLNEDFPAVVWNASTNQFLVVWEDYRASVTRGVEIYGRRVAAGGTMVGASVRISDSTFNEYKPAVIWNETANQYVVIWEDYRNTVTRGTDIYGRRVGPNGGMVGSNFSVGNSTAGEYTPAAVWNATANEYLVVWQDLRNFATRGRDIFARRWTGDTA